MKLNVRRFMVSLPRSVLACDGHLAHLLGDLEERVVGGIRSLLGANNLDELHCRDG